MNGLSINNPGNLEYRPQDKWQGLADPPQVNGKCSFKTMAFGVRAATRQLIANQDHHDCHTIRAQITRWAPPTENPTQAYIHNVETWSGRAADAPLDMHNYDDARPMLAAMFRQEQGIKDCVPDVVLDEGLRLAGVVAEQKSMAQAMATDPKVIATTVATTAATAQATVSSVADLWDTLNHYIDPRYLVWACVACVLVAAAYCAYNRFWRHRLGLTT